MPANKLTQRSFVSGQYDRIAQNQESLSGSGIVASGMSYAKNVLSSDKGELRKRLGTKFLRRLSSATVLIPFRMTDEDDAILTADTSYIKGYRYVDGNLVVLQSVRAGSTVTFPAANTWANGTESADSITNGDWTVTISFRYQNTTGISYNNTYPGWLLNGSSGVNQYNEQYYDGYVCRGTTNMNAPQYITFYNATTASCMRHAKIWFYKSSNDGYEYGAWINPVIQYSDDGSTWVGVQTDQSLDEYTNFRNFPQHGSGGAIVRPVYVGRCRMTVSQSNYSGKHKYWRVYFQSQNETVNAVCISEMSFVDVSDVHDFQETSPYTESQLKNIKYSQDKNTMFVVSEDVIPYKLLNNTGELTWGSFTPSQTSTIWTTMGGYPSAVSLFQNRLWFGGFENNPTTVIASKFNDYETFHASSTAVADDYLNLRCNQLKTRIKNLVGGQTVMYCFSEDGISNIDGGSTGMIATNSNIEFILKNRMPAGSSTPAFKDDVMLYSSSDGTKLYGLDYDLLVSRFQVNDLAIYAKDITRNKITELHYVNNESKLVYGLTESGIMFALLYEKGQYKGFFPLDFSDGYVYDICPIKVGRDYKLLMVVLRNGNWYLEEKLDCGQFIDTGNPRLTSDEKKWATFDNLYNNIALDCYQSYNQEISGEFVFDSTTKVLTSVNLSSYIDKNVMFSSELDGDFVIATVDSIQTLYAWNGNSTLDASGNWFTLSSRPTDGDLVYDKDGNVMTGYNTSGSYIEGDPGHISILAPEQYGIRQGFSAYENTAANRYIVTVEIEARRGTSTSYSKAYPEFTKFQPNLPSSSSIAVVSDGRYFNAQTPDSDGYITLPAKCYRAIYGINYEAVAILKLQAPYESMKCVEQVNVSVVDTHHLEVGTDFSDTLNIEKIDSSSYYDLTRITMNDTYRLVVSDTPETTKNIILRSNKGLPFTINSVEVYVNYSNLGGD